MHSEAEIRINAIKILGETNNQIVVEPLITALKDTVAKVRDNAAEALGKLKDSRAVTPLINAFRPLQNIKTS